MSLSKNQSGVDMIDMNIQYFMSYKLNQKNLQEYHLIEQFDSNSSIYINQHLLKMNPQKSICSIKREAFQKKSAAQFREAYRKAIRRTFLQQKQNNFCFQSQALQKFDYLDDHSHIQMQFCQIFDIIQCIDIQAISDQQADNLASDLIYLVIEKDFICPYSLKLKKNQANLSATLIALVADKVNPEQLKYWINYMGEQARMIVYNAVETQNQSSRIWVQDQFFVQKILLDWNLVEASKLVALLLKESIYISEAFIHKVTFKLINKTKSLLLNNNEIFTAQEFQMIIYLIRLYKQNGIIGRITLQISLNEIIQHYNQVQLEPIFQESTVSCLETYFQEMYNEFQIKITQENFVKMMKVLTNSLKKGRYLFIDNKFSEKILISNTKMVMNICIFYLRVSAIRKSGFCFKEKQILQKLNPNIIKKQLTEENLQGDIVKLEKIFTKILILIK